MTDRGEAMRRPPRAPMPRRTRRRWAVAAGVAACWAVALATTGSVVAGTALLLLMAALGTACVLAMRAVGVSAAHPWVQRIRSRPWRDGQDVLQLGLRHLPEVFVITPGGSLLAPNSIELWLNPRDFGSLCELMDINLVNASAAEVYQEQVAAHGARFARPGVAEVRVVSDPSVPPGRYRLRQACPLDTAPALQPVPDSPLVPPAAGLTPTMGTPMTGPHRPGPLSPARRRSPSVASARFRCCGWSQVVPPRRPRYRGPARGAGMWSSPYPRCPRFPGNMPGSPMPRVSGGSRTWAATG